MKANWIAGGLLLVLYLLWLTATAPARLLAPMLPPGVQVGQFSGSVWRGAAQPVYWHGERLERLALVADPGGLAGLSQRSPRRDGSGPAVGPSRSAPTGGAAHRPRQPAQPLVDATMPVKAAGEVTFSLTEGRFSDGRCRHIIAGGAQWRQARLHSPVGSLELAQVNGTFRCTVDGAVALTLRQDSHQLSLSGQGDSVARWPLSVSRHATAPGRGMPPLLALLVTRPTANNAPGPTPWQLQGKWLPQEQK